VAALPVAAAEASQAEWRLVVAALLASCSVAAARAWLGYVPAELQRQAAAAVRPLHAGLTAPVMRGLDQSADLLSQLDSSVVGTSSSSANSISQSESSTAVDSNSRGSTNSSGSGSGSEQAEAGVEDVSLWVPAQRCSLLHANVIRFLRFGESTPQCGADPLEAMASTSGQQFASETESPTSAADGASKEASPSSEAAVASGTQTALRASARTRLTSAPPGIRGWRHQNLAEAWEGGAVSWGPSVLHHMAVCAADAVAMMYLAEARAGMAGGPAKPSMVVMEGCWPVFLDRTLSNSRALERFRNQVAFRRWLQTSVWDVVAIYEDRHEVLVVGPSATLVRKSVPFKRTQELDSLTGPAAAMCLLLELNDVGAPLLHMLARRLASAVQWLLTTLIGRSLGLIVRGVRQSFTWGQGPKDPSTPPAKEPASTQYAPRFA